MRDVQRVVAEPVFVGPSPVGSFASSADGRSVCLALTRACSTGLETAF